MLFNSFAFFIFLPVVFAIYHLWLIDKIRWRNLFLLVVSYIFYGWWDWRFLGLIAISTLIDYLVALQIEKTGNKTKQKCWLAISLAGNLGMLGIFKYYNFFTGSLIQLLDPLGIHLNAFTINVTLPVGISFYTFQTLSYTIDVYRGNMKPTKDMVAFFAYVSFFPQLVAGPIERAHNLLPQFFKAHYFHYHSAVDAVKRMIWGFFKKMVIADTCAIFIEPVFNHPEGYGGLMLLTSAILFSIEVYCDFSGYSDIAIGTAQLFGFKLMENFRTPFFSTTVAEFWRRWHISLTTWFRDYVYYPLGGSKGNQIKTLWNIFIVFLVSGLWHGANATFVVWAIFIVLSYYFDYFTGQKHKKSTHFINNNPVPSLKNIPKMIWVMMVFSLSMIFFRSPDISHAVNYFKNLFNWPFRNNIPGFRLQVNDNLTQFFMLLFFIALMFIIEWVNRNQRHVFDFSRYTGKKNTILLIFIIMSIIFFGRFNHNSFVYFQF